MNRGNTTLATGSGERVVVVGGGVIGLSIALELASRGVRPQVVDPGRPPGQATWASGGMLAPLGEATEPGPFLAFAQESLALYPAFAERVEELSGTTVGLHLNGKILAALSEGDEARIRERQRWLEAAGHAVEWLPAPHLRRRIPALSSNARGGLLLKGNGRVNSRALLRGLEAAAEACGVGMVRGRVDQIETRAGAASGVTLDSGERIAADRVVLAAGAWSDLLPGAGPATAPGVRPVKGEMLSFSTPARPLDTVVTSPRVYLIPRETPGGPVVLAGATEEEAGFDGRLSRRGQEVLQSGAEELLPELIGAPVQERWAGFRPGTSDQLPMVGHHPRVAGLYLATGHFRNGILLAPATARLIADRIRWGSSGDPAPGSWAAALDPARVVT